MSLLERYIGKHQLFGTFLVLAILVFLMGFMELERELSDLGERDYGLGPMFSYVALRLPHFAYQILPVAALIGTLAGLGVLARHSELIAMRAAGFSVMAVAIATVKTGVFLVGMSFVLGEIVAPQAGPFAERIRAEALYGQVTLRTKYGFWARDGESFVNIRRVFPGMGLGDISIYEFTPDRNLKLATHAQRASYVDGGWELRNIAQSEFLDGEVRSRLVERARWISFIDPGLVKLVIADPTVLAAWDLYRFIQYLEENNQSTKIYEVAFWNKLINPLLILVMLFLAVPFVMGNLRSGGLSARLLLGAVLGASFLLLNRAFGNLAVVYDMNPLLAASFPTLLCFGLAFWAVHRV